ncbi:MAG: HD-GYP domain-containing protein [Phycisphaeraceae bacterium]|nr:HD-GYP domain-containing protein [Phycisphaeraceae bacterium]
MSAAKRPLLTTRNLLVAALLLAQLLAVLLVLALFENRLNLTLVNLDQQNPQALMTLLFEVRLMGLLLVALLLALSALLAFIVIRSHDRQLAAIHQKLEQIVEDRSRDIVRSRDAVIFGLAMLAEQRDGETGEHLERIGQYTDLIARAYAARHTGYDQRWVHTLRVTCVLHDIGKVAIPDAILRKPEALTDEERHVIEQHPYFGGHTLHELQRRWGEDQFLTTAADICLGHHERWDGQGYPFGRNGAEIPLPARIVAIADVYDALTSRRHYKEQMSHEQAKLMIMERSETHFDPAVVEAFLACEKELEKIAFDPHREVTDSGPAAPEI